MNKQQPQVNQYPIIKSLATAETFAWRLEETMKVGDVITVGHIELRKKSQYLFLVKGYTHSVIESRCYDLAQRIFFPMRKEFNDANRAGLLPVYIENADLEPQDIAEPVVVDDFDQPLVIEQTQHWATTHYGAVIIISLEQYFNGSNYVIGYRAFTKSRDFETMYYNDKYWLLESLNALHLPAIDPAFACDQPLDPAFHYTKPVVFPQVTANAEPVDFVDLPATNAAEPVAEPVDSNQLSFDWYAPTCDLPSVDALLGSYAGNVSTTPQVKPVAVTNPLFDLIPYVESDSAGSRLYDLAESFVAWYDETFDFMATPTFITGIYFALMVALIRLVTL